jgi:hypothetical protein
MPTSGRRVFAPSVGQESSWVSGDPFDYDFLDTWARMFSIGQLQSRFRQFSQKSLYNESGSCSRLRMIEDPPSEREHRGLAAGFALCAAATLTLLTAHPNAGTGSLADFLKEAVHDQYADEVVHGGFLVTLGILIVCFVFLSRRLGFARPSVIVGLTAFCIGSGMLMASMVLDGFVTPAIAVRLAGALDADNLLVARTLLILLGTLIRFLMSGGVMFQAAAMFSWSLVIVRGQRMQRTVGALGLLAAPALIVGLTAASGTTATHLLLGSIVLHAIWYASLAVLIFRRRLCSDTIESALGDHP